MFKEEEHGNILTLRLAGGLRVFMLTCIITHTCDIYNICVIYNFIMQYLIHLKEYINLKYKGFLVAQMVRICLQCGRPGFDPWVGKIP